MIKTYFLVDDYEASRKREALRVRLDEKATWDQIFEKTMFLVCNTAKRANSRQLNQRCVRTGLRPSWDTILARWELYGLERIRKERTKDLEIPAGTTWEQMAMIKTEKMARRSKFIKRLNRCRRKCPLTWKQRETLREKEAISAGLPKDSKWRLIIQEKTTQQFEEEIAISVNYLGFSPDAGFAELYNYIVARFADENRKKEADALNLKETATWDEILEVKALHNLDLRRLEEISLFGFDENTTWDALVLNRYLIELDISREEAARELNLPIHSSWNEIMKEGFTVEIEE